MARPRNTSKSSQSSQKSTVKKSAKAPRKAAAAKSPSKTPEHSPSKSREQSLSPSREKSPSASREKSPSVSPEKTAEKIVVENASLDDSTVSQPAAQSNAAEKSPTSSASGSPTNSPASSPVRQTPQLGKRSRGRPPKKVSNLNSSTSKVIDKKKKSKLPIHKYNTQYRKILKQLDEGKGYGHFLHPQSKVIMNNLMADIYERLTREAAFLVKHSKKSTLTASNIRTAVKFVFPGQLGQYAQDEGQKAITKLFG